MSQTSQRAVGKASGKVILLGEHAVVHGSPALAQAVPLGAEVAAERAAGPLRLRVEPWGLEVSAGDGTPGGTALAALARSLGTGITGVDLVGQSRLPPRAGLGSSAALATAAARALAASLAIELDDDLLFDAVQASERVFHGNPSGLDAAVAIRGGALRFDRENGVTPLEAEPVPLVVIHSGVEGRTAETVAAFGRWLAEHPDEGHDRLARIAELAEAGAAAVEGGDLEALGRAMDECHDHLSWFGVSTEELDRICRTARGAGAMGAKLTGGGGGGCAVALVRAENRGAVAEAARAAGYRVVLE